MVMLPLKTIIQNSFLVRLYARQPHKSQVRPYSYFSKKKFTIRINFDQLKIKPLELCCLFCKGGSIFSIWQCITLTYKFVRINLGYLQAC